MVQVHPTRLRVLIQWCQPPPGGTEPARRVRTRASRGCNHPCLRAPSTCSLSLWMCVLWLWLSLWLLSLAVAVAGVAVAGVAVWLCYWGGCRQYNKKASFKAMWPFWGQHLEAYRTGAAPNHRLKEGILLMMSWLAKLKNFKTYRTKIEAILEKCVAHGGQCWRRSRLCVWLCVAVCGCGCCIHARSHLHIHWCRATGMSSQTSHRRLRRHTCKPVPSTCTSTLRWGGVWCVRIHPALTQLVAWCDGMWWCARFANYCDIPWRKPETISTATKHIIGCLNADRPRPVQFQAAKSFVLLLQSENEHVFAVRGCVRVCVCVWLCVSACVCVWLCVCPCMTLRVATAHPCLTNPGRGRERV